MEYLMADETKNDETGEQPTKPVEALKPEVDEAAKTEPAKTEPAKTEPAKTEPAKTEPAKTEPAKTEGAQTEAAKTAENRVDSTSFDAVAEAVAVHPALQREPRLLTPSAQWSHYSRYIYLLSQFLFYGIILGIAVWLAQSLARSEERRVGKECR